ncbi:hypothetical protein BDN72DRAFT_310103 [Pluteus cervinus]|uniref:Uncharacterized protein n=1 Tax=Pluteus cervinus TaxID=181527 RepID=A0ACD3ACF4_9AGAR|nr:hypothetical protein BDN72DRAFT_310103 [Pluteus cervinus]
MWIPPSDFTTCNPFHITATLTLLPRCNKVTAPTHAYMHPHDASMFAVNRTSSVSHCFSICLIRNGHGSNMTVVLRLRDLGRSILRGLNSLEAVVACCGITVTTVTRRFLRRWIYDWKDSFNCLMHTMSRPSVHHSFRYEVVVFKCTLFPSQPILSVALPWSTQMFPGITKILKASLLCVATISLLLIKANGMRTLISGSRKPLFSLG